ncbi:peptide/nickel transport system substrate-binding protein [Cupriavidus gilardii J11]|uniref:Peptide/nickel transport system substrate-binding protein n=1 Tax=Cupriavidus gilardii J11 TaxID=936133 RepID=A0A562BAS0_9BURK|nr:ABC transporter substrate-binding protein [Cupriavidus gilardii]TWG82254.1 peptide/nickel transport system substrate-binding protein [Cupriavidus gilardii J11]
MQFVRRTLHAAALATSLVLGVAALPGHAASLTIGLSGDITSLDPHYHNVTPNANVAEHMFETLIAKDEKMRFKPGLATSWKAIDDTTWEVKLRPGVRFHDGSEFTSADVVFSLARPALVKNSPSPYTIYTKGFKDVTAVDKLTVRITTDGPYPLVPNDLSTIYMVSKKVAENASSDDFNSGKAMVGTGPYKFVSFRKGDRVELTRNEAYWGPKPEWETVSLRILTNDAPRVAALLAGDVQVIENVPTSDIRNLSGNGSVSVFKVPTFRMMYLHMDSNREVSPFVADKSGKPLARNPLKDARVRQAISRAISRQAIVERVMEGAAEPTGQLVNNTLFGHVPGLKPETQDVAAAKKLLAEAGYPDGFQLTLHSPNNRYVNDEQVAQAIASMLTRVGIQTRVEAMPSATFFTRANKLEFSFMLAGWGADTGEAGSSLKSLLATYDTAKGWGASNRGRYSNPALDAKLSAALTTIDDRAREKLLQEATEIGVKDYGVIPLYYQINVWAAKKGLTVIPRQDERTYAFSIKR